MEQFSIERSLRKTLSMSFRQKKLVIKAPFFVTKKVINDFVLKHQWWIESQIEKQKESKIDETKISEYKKQAKQYIIPRVALLANKYGFQYNCIKITSAKSRWGSCTSAKNLNFSYRLVLTPPEVIDYVIIHELCHLRYMDHSKNFWNEIKSIMPEYKIHDDWLKKNAYMYR